MERQAETVTARGAPASPGGSPAPLALAADASPADNGRHAEPFLRFVPGPLRRGSRVGCVLAAGLASTLLLFRVLPALGVEVPGWARAAGVVVFLVFFAVACLLAPPLKRGRANPAPAPGAGKSP